MVALILAVAQVLGDLVADDGEVLFAFGGPVPHHAHDFLVDLRVQGREGKVFQFPFDGVHAEPVGQRGEDFQGFAGLARRGLGRDEAPGPGVVQPVGELDHQDPDVLGHGHDHLADGFRLRGLAEADLVQLGDAVHQHGDFRAELGLQVIQGVGGVLDGVVQERRGQGGSAEPEFGQDGGHRHRVGDVGVPALALLAPVAAFRYDEGALDEVEVLFGVVGPDGAQQRLKDGGIGGGAAAGQAGKPRTGALTPAGKRLSCARTVHGHRRIGAFGSHHTSLRTLAWSLIHRCCWHRRRTFFQWSTSPNPLILPVYSRSRILR